MPAPTRRLRQPLAAPVALGALIAAVWTTSLASPSHAATTHTATTRAAAVRPAAARPAAATTTPPNIVFVLTDDLAWNLVQYMPQVQKMQQQGVTFTNYTVTDSLCCPSRSTIFTGNFPHDTGVFTNTSPDGGFALFHGRGEESQTYATDLRSLGYSTAMMGKYLNGYTPADTEGGSQLFVPPGWSE